MSKTPIKSPAGASTLPSPTGGASRSATALPVVSPEVFTDPLAVLNSKSHRALLNRAFNFYAKSGHSFFTIDSFDATQRENENLDLSEVFNMLRDLRIMPQCVSRDAVTTAFKAAASADAGTVVNVDMARLLSADEFPQFLIGLADAVFASSGSMADTAFAQPDADQISRVRGLCSLFHAAALNHRELKPSANATIAKDAPTIAALHPPRTAAPTSPTPQPRTRTKATDVTDAMLAVLAAPPHHVLVNRMFTHYAKSGHSHFAHDSFDTTMHENMTVDNGELFKLMNDCKLMPQCISRDTVTAIFKASAGETNAEASVGKVAPGHVAANNVEFRRILVRIAIALFASDGAFAHTSYAHPEADPCEPVRGICTLLHAVALKHVDLKGYADVAVAQEAPHPVKSRLKHSASLPANVGINDALKSAFGLPTRPVPPTRLASDDVYTIHYPQIKGASNSQTLKLPQLAPEDESWKAEPPANVAAKRLERQLAEQEARRVANEVAMLQHARERTERKIEHARKRTQALLDSMQKRDEDFRKKADSIDKRNVEIDQHRIKKEMLKQTILEAQQKAKFDLQNSIRAAAEHAKEEEARNLERVRQARIDQVAAATQSKWEVRQMKEAARIKKEQADEAARQAAKQAFDSREPVFARLKETMRIEASEKKTAVQLHAEEVRAQREREHQYKLRLARHNWEERARAEEEKQERQNEEVARLKAQKEEAFRALQASHEAHEAHALELEKTAFASTSGFLSLSRAHSDHLLTMPTNFAPRLLSANPISTLPARNRNLAPLGGSWSSPTGLGSAPWSPMLRTSSAAAGMFGFEDLKPSTSHHARPTS